MSWKGIWPALGSALVAGGLALRYFLGAPIKFHEKKSAAKSLPTVVTQPGVYHRFLGYLHLSKAQKQLQKAVAQHPLGIMASSIDESQFLAWIIHTTQAKRVVEVGVFMGSSTLAMAQALPDDGQIFALDVSKEFTALGAKAWKDGGVSHKIDLRLGPATDSLRQMIDRDGLEGKLDFAFIDANKDDYDTYYELCLQLLRKGGIVAIDNVYWHGAVLSANKDSQTRAICTLSDKVASDKRVLAVTIPLADGVTLCTKL